MKLWPRFLLGSALALLASGVAHAASNLRPTGVTVAPSSAKPGDTVTFTLSVQNSGAATPADDFLAASTANFTITFSNVGSGYSFTRSGTGSTASVIAGAGGAGTMTFSAQIPTQTTEAGTYDASVVITSVTGGGGFSGAAAGATSALTVTGKPNLMITNVAYPSGTSYRGGDIIPMTLTYKNTQATLGTQNVPVVPGSNGFASYFRIKLVLSTNATFGDGDDFQLTFYDDAVKLNADDSIRTINWNQLLPGNFAGSYYIIAKIDALDAIDENDNAALTVNGDNIWGTNALTPTATLINLLPSNFPSMTLVSHTTVATGSGNAYSDNPSMSSDGRYVAFASDASNLVANDTNAVRDIFIFDSQTSYTTANSIRRLSVSQQGGQANAASNNPAVSGNGRYVAFASDANNLITASSTAVGDTNGFSDIYVVDTINGQIARMSVTTGGAQANNPSFKPAISYSGRYIVFESTATNLDPAYSLSAVGGFSHIYLRDRDVSGSGTFDTVGNVSTKLVDVDSAAPTTTAGNASAFQAVISSSSTSATDGLMIAFASKSTNLQATASGGFQQVYVRPRANVGTATNGSVMVSVVTGTGVAGTADSQTPSLNQDGKYVAFASLASNLLGAGVDTNGVSDIFVYDTTQAVGTPVVRRMSVANNGTQGVDPTVPNNQQLGSINPTISSTGRYVAFASLDNNLTTGDSVGQFQGSGATAGAVTVAAGTITAIAVGSGGTQYSQTRPPRVVITDPTGSGASYTATVSAAGVVTGFVQVSAGAGYSATPSVVVASDSNTALDVFVRDRDSTASGTFDTVAATTQMVSVNTFGYQTFSLLGTPSTAANNIYPVMSSDGRFVALPSDSEGIAGLAFSATNQVSLDSNTARDVFIFDRRTTTLPNSSVAPVVTITNPGNGGTALVNTPISVTASATTTVGVVASVQFFVNGTSLGTTSTFPYSATWTPTAVGTYTLSALVTDSFGNLGVSPNVTVSINAAPSVGIVNPIGGRSIVVGTATSVTATAAPSNPTGVMTSVQFFANGQSLGTVTVAPYTVTWTPATTGAFSLTAVALETIGGGPQTTQTTSPTVAVTVVAASGGGGGGGTAPTVSLSPIPPAGVAVNSSVNLTATATAGVGFTVANVQYFANGVSIGSSAAFPYLVKWTPTALGTYAITAVAIDNAGSTSTSTGANVVVSTGTAPTIVLVSPNSGASYAVGSPISLSASTTLGSGLIAGVDFFANNVAIGSKTVGASGQGSVPFFNLEWSPAAAGSYVFYAVVTDTSGNRTSSTSVTVTVAAVAAPVVTVTSPSSGTTLTVNQTQTVAAAATAGTGATITSVAFFANGQSLGSDTTFPFSASWTPTAPGTYLLAAVATDSFGTQKTSSTVSVIVGSGSSSLPFVYLTSVPTGTNVTANTPVYLAANAGDPDGVVTNVQFYANGQLIGAKATAPYATIWTPTTATNYSVTAVVTDDAGNRVTSTVSTITALVQVGVVPVAGLDFNNPAVDTPTGSAAATPVPLFTPIKVDYGSKLIFSASAVDQDGSIANVQFFVNGTNIATLGAAPYYTTYTLNTLSDITVTAIVTDNSGNAIYTTPILISTQANDPTGDLVTLVSPLNGSTYVTGGQVIFSATHNFGTANPPKIDFYLNGSQFTTVKSASTGGASAPYEFIIGLTRAGTYDVHAVLRLGNTTTISTPARITVTSNTAPTVSIRSPSNGGTYVIGTSLTIAANAADVDGTIQNVKFFVNGTALSTATAAPYNAAWSPGSPGIYTLTASATDDAGTQTLATPVVVTYTGNAAPSVSLSTPSVGARVVAGAPVSLVATASDIDGTVTSVRFLANGTVVGTGSAAPFTATWTPTAAGIYSVIAQATDNSGNITSSTAVSVNVLVNQPPVVRVTTPINGASTPAGTATNLVADASDPDGTIDNVKFLINGSVLGAPVTTSTSSSYTVPWTPRSAGTYTVVAQATDNTGNVASSAAVTVTVLANQSPTVVLTSPANGAVVTAGLATTLSASASDPDGTVRDVQFFANGGSLGAAVTVRTSGSYRQQWNPDVPGIYTITATATDNSGAATSTTATVLVVNTASGGGDTVYTGNLFGANETGRFAVISISGKTAAVLGYSTVGAGKVYFYPSIAVNAAGGFNLADATGRVLVAGSVNETAVTITNLDGAPTTQIGIKAFPSGSAVASGYYTGSLSGRPASQLAAIVGPDGSILLVAADGGVRAAGAGVVDSTGAFRNIAATGGGVFNGKADPLTNFLSGSLTGPLAGGLMGAVESGVSFSDGFLRNLSSRGQVGTGTNVLVAGFVVGGTTPKQVLVRAIGPSLVQFGITGALADPQLQLFGGAGGSVLVSSNNNWGGTVPLFDASNSVGAFPLSPTSLDAVLLATLAPGNYTAQVSGVGGTSGTALVELYDVDNPTAYSSQKVINISTRAVVGTGQGRLIAGFVISGNTSKKVLIRAVGPTLGATPFNVPGVLADPVLRLIRNSDNMLVRENDSWEVGNDATLVGDATTKSGAFPLAPGSKDAVILISLPPGTYSAEVTGSGASTGIALVEVYEVP